MAVKAMTLVGLDVHARQTHAAIMDLSSGRRRAELRVRAGRPGRELRSGALHRERPRRSDAPRHRLSKFLLRRGERYPGPGGARTAEHLAWLRAHHLQDPCAQGAFVDYLPRSSCSSVAAARRSALEHALPDSSHAAVVARLRCFRGIDTLSGAGLSAEIGDWRRFPRPALLSGFLGIVPCERTSDTKRRQGSTTKAVPPHARRLLVEAAHHYRYEPRVGQALARRQQGQ